MAEPAASKTHRSAPSMEQTVEKPWVAMWSLVIGFFMILLDTTIVTVALPHMQHELNASLSAVILGDQRLPARLCGAAADYRSLRR